MAPDISTILDIIARDLKGIRRLEDLASRFNKSPETMRKALRRMLGVSFSDLRDRLVEEQMKTMLVQTDERCNEICYAVGFDREDSGAKFFKRRIGMTMMEFRKSGVKSTKRSNGGNGARPAEANLQSQPLKPTSKGNLQRQ